MPRKSNCSQPLSPKDRQVHEQGLVSVLRQLHDELDAAVLAAYGWEDLSTALRGNGSGIDSAGDVGEDAPSWGSAIPGEEEVLQRLVALNTERAAEERCGLIRWLRPEFQNPGQHPTGADQAQAEAELTVATPAASGSKTDWPKALPDQFQALRTALAARPGPQNAAELAQGFTRAPRSRVTELLDTLVTLGYARRLEDGRYLPG